MEHIIEEPLVPKTNLSQRIILLLEFHLIIILIYSISPNDIIFWTFLIVLILGIELYSYRKLRLKKDNPESQSLWRKIFETPILPFFAFVLVLLVFIDKFKSLIHNYKSSKTDETSLRKSQLKYVIDVLIMIFMIILIIFIPILLFNIFNSIISYSLTQSGFGIYERSEIIIWMISFLLVELSLILLYYTIDVWIRKPYVQGEPQPVTS